MKGDTVQPATYSFADLDVVDTPGEPPTLTVRTADHTMVYTNENSPLRTFWNSLPGDGGLAVTEKAYDEGRVSTPEPDTLHIDLSLVSETDVDH